jgi:hypothetical protein
LPDKWQHPGRDLSDQVALASEQELKYSTEQKGTHPTSKLDGGKWAEDRNGDNDETQIQITTRIETQCRIKAETNENEESRCEQTRGKVWNHGKNRNEVQDET